MMNDESGRGRVVLGPYELNTIIQGDCLEAMPGIPDRSIGLILADLPYQVTQNDWDSLIPLEPLWREYKRIIRAGGAIVLTASQPFASMLVMSNLAWFKWEDVWRKSLPTRHLDCRRMPLRQHESILIFCDGNPTYNPQLSKSPGASSRKKYAAAESYGKFNETAERTIDKGLSYPRSVVDFPTAYHEGEAGLHPSQKSVGLFSYLIRTYSNPGDLVLDSCCGSATTAIAAIETGRDWLCIEQEARYVEIGRERVRERMSQPFLPGLVEAGPRVHPEPVEGPTQSGLWAER